MDQLKKQAAELKEAVEQAVVQIKLAELQSRQAELRQVMNRPDFWQDSASAQQISRQEAELTKRIQPWDQLRQSASEAVELANLDDPSMTDEISRQITEISTSLEELKKQLRFRGEYDDHDAIVSIYAGAGGTDAQDWAQMLYEMYTRWANQSGLEVNGIAMSPGEEAGIKSAVLDIKGSFAYGKLKGEQGVHRLVRLSPYNADNLRQTSFAKVEVVPKIDRPGDMAIDDKDLKVETFRAGGHGGQSVNTTDSAVRVTHMPTGITVAIQNERSQLQNKETALTILRSKLAQLQLEQHKDRVEELKGPNQSAEWGNQIRSYVLHPYKQVKDLRTGYETSEPDKVLSGGLDPLIDAWLEQNLG